MRIINITMHIVFKAKYRFQLLEGMVKSLVKYDL